MTAVAERGAAYAWHAMPGWAVVADLTPPELGAARRLRSLKRAIVAGLVLVVLLCAGGYVLATMANSQAQDDLDAVASRTTVLTAAGHRYAAVTQVKSATAGVQQQLATLLSTDVDAAALANRFQAALAPGMALTAVTVSLNSTDTAAMPSGTGTADGSAGTVTLTGSAKHLSDLAGYVTALGRVRGVTNVVPTNNTAGSDSVTWTVSLDLTNAVYSHRYRTATQNTTTPSGGQR